MATNTILIKRNTTNSNAPDTDDIAEGEIALNTVAGKLYMRKSDDSIISFTDSSTLVQANTDEAVALAIALG
jgi:DNA-binding beta-propeller fold protein YncE